MKNRERFTYTHKSVMKKGLRDGRDYVMSFWPLTWSLRKTRQPYPIADQDSPAQFEQELTDAASADLQELARNWKEQDEKLKPAYDKAAIALANARADNARAASTAATATGQYNTVQREFTDYPATVIAPFWMHAWLILLGISEFLFNSVAFEIFGQRKFETFVIAAGVGIALPLIAHYIGQNLRQNVRTMRDNLLAGLWTSIVVLSVYMLAMIREKFFEAQHLESILGITLSPAESAVIFITLNLLLFGSGVLVAFQGSYPDQSAFNTLRKRYKRAEQDFNSASGRAAAAKQQLEQAERVHTDARNAREKMFEQWVEQAARLLKNNDWYIQVYRTANMQSRLDSGTPACFENEPVLAQMPEALKGIDWDIDYGHQSTLRQQSEAEQRAPSNGKPPHHLAISGKGRPGEST